MKTFFFVLLLGMCLNAFGASPTGNYNCQNLGSVTVISANNTIIIPNVGVYSIIFSAPTNQGSWLITINYPNDGGGPYSYICNLQ